MHQGNTVKKEVTGLLYFLHDSGLYGRRIDKIGPQKFFKESNNLIGYLAGGSGRGTCRAGRGRLAEGHRKKYQQRKPPPARLPRPMKQVRYCV